MARGKQKWLKKKKKKGAFPKILDIQKNPKSLIPFERLKLET
jgi:hypothetical protein